MNKALVIFSGGQDSTTCLGWALKHYDSVAAFSLIYGQRHRIEIECAKEITKKLNVPHYIFTVKGLNSLVESALLNSEDNISDHHKRLTNLPASFVPNRNALILTLAHARAQTIGANSLITGVCQTDYSGYPDCRNEFIGHLERTLNIGSEADIKIHTPLMWLTKAQTFELADNVGILPIVIEYSQTCYEGDATRNLWGKGCGKCPACLLRKKGWEEYVEMKKANK